MLQPPATFQSNELMSTRQRSDVCSGLLKPLVRVEGLAGDTANSILFRFVFQPIKDKYIALLCFNSFITRSLYNRQEDCLMCANVAQSALKSTSLTLENIYLIT